MVSLAGGVVNYPPYEGMYRHQGGFFYFDANGLLQHAGQPAPQHRGAIQPAPPLVIEEGNNEDADDDEDDSFDRDDDEDF